MNLSPAWQLDAEMREYRPSEPVDFCIIGSGCGGGVLAQRLSRSGFSVVCLEAGGWVDSEHDMVSDEKGSHFLYWNDLQITGGRDPLVLGSNLFGKTVGGSTVHYAAFCPRFHPSDFMVRTLDGVADDWPFRYEDLEPYYELMEREFPVAGPPYYPWGKPHGYPYAPLQSGTAGHVLIQGCLALGIPVVPGGPIGITAGTFGKRAHCIFRGFCIQGCKVGAKQSILVSHIPDAVDHGAEIRDHCLAYEIPLGDDGRVTGVRYFQTLPDGTYREDEQKARHVVVAGYAVQTPRILLNSTSGRFPNGLANSSGLVGKRLMTQTSNVVFGRYDRPIRQYKAPPACASTEEYYETDPRNDFVRGYSIQTVAPLPIGMAEVLSAGPTFGWTLRHRMAEYNHYAGIGMLGEVLPDERNYVGIADEKDQFGVPVAYVHFNLFENDRRIVVAAIPRMRAIQEAAGAVETFSVPDSAHVVGSCRMGDKPSNSVVDQYCRSWDVPNLTICDGSVLVTEGAANPALTIAAIAARTADALREAARRQEL
ncbi:MAG TPA: GMC family oxidoreductase [Chloroflexota bacterium]|nr:GMC family oxidoreductase [Chloroflexota bacterium]